MERLRRKIYTYEFKLEAIRLVDEVKHRPQPGDRCAGDGLPAKSATGGVSIGFHNYEKTPGAVAG